MRWLAPLSATVAAFAALTLASNAAAAPVTIAPVTFSAEFQTALNDDLGAREGPFLQRVVEQNLAGALSRAGASVGSSGGLTIETTIIDADPNKPTLEQLSDTPGLSAIDSVSLGGAELVAVIRAPDGSVVAEVRHRRYSTTIAEVVPASGQWTDAHRAIRQFATKVAAAYRANAR